MHEIIIPVGCADMGLKEMQTFCARFDLTAEYEDSKKAYFLITGKNPTNFFWLGANMAAPSSGTPLATTLRDTIKKEVSHG